MVATSLGAVSWSCMQFVWDRVWTVSKSDCIGDGAMAPMMLFLEGSETVESALLLIAAGCSIMPSILVAGPD